MLFGVGRRNKKCVKPGHHRMQNLVLRRVPLVEPGIADFIREQATDDDRIHRQPVQGKVHKRTFRLATTMNVYGTASTDAMAAASEKIARLALNGAQTERRVS